MPHLVSFTMLTHDSQAMTFAINAAVFGPHAGYRIHADHGDRQPAVRCEGDVKSGKQGEDRVDGGSSSAWDGG